MFRFRAAAPDRPGVHDLVATFGPVIQIGKILEHRSSRSDSVAYFAVLLVGFLLWLSYGIAASNVALIVPNAVAAIMLTVTILGMARYRRASA